ncbi:Protein of unknown function [Rheinheimera pacifica]|uniref:GlyGly-CTERM domain-containing protein n=1 Tax=Rheinheimera pacifica TaxID=173990 RepID=A0A1H6LM26_9GAMM|nr:DUF3466 family protein [Rheinheimera pacifica]SEH89638.1 Protein of unknown function [Rheinheimera pacifica]
MKLSRISLAILPLLSLCSVQAAVYNVVEIGEVSEVKSTYAAAINDSGHAVFNGAIRLQTGTSSSGLPIYDYQYFNFPINLDAIDFEDEDVQAFFTDEQLADVTNGNINNTILNILLNRNPAGQPIGNTISYLKTGNLAPENILLRDSTEPTRGNSEYLYDINNAGIAVGVAGTTFTLESFTPTSEDGEEEEVQDLWVPAASYQLGVVVQNGQVRTIDAPYQELGGGYTVAMTISDSGLIAGFGSSGMTDAAKEAVETACTGASQPVATCLYNRAVAGSYLQRGMVWQLQADGSVAAPEILGFLGNKNTGTAFDGEGVNAITYFSVANDVNDNGIVVGRSLYSDSDRTQRVRLNNGQVVDQIVRAQHASLYVEDQVLPLVDPLEWSISDAVAVNNNNIIIGYGQKVINSAARNKMFYHDYNAGQTRFVDGFFSSSTTQPKAINDSNQVVGQAEVILGGTTTRRRHGFIYDITADSFTDLNTLIGCNSPYTVVDATDINNNGDILATALTMKERKDLLGEVVVDAQGNPLKEELAVVVKLQPVANGEPEDCASEQTKYERKGGAAGFGWLTLSAAFIWWRRRKV